MSENQQCDRRVHPPRQPRGPDAMNTSPVTDHELRRQAVRKAGACAIGVLRIHRSRRSYYFVECPHCSTHCCFRSSHPKAAKRIVLGSLLRHLLQCHRGLLAGDDLP